MLDGIRRRHRPPLSASLIAALVLLGACENRLEGGPVEEGTVLVETSAAVDTAAAADTETTPEVSADNPFVAADTCDHLLTLVGEAEQDGFGLDEHDAALQVAVTLDECEWYGKQLQINDNIDYFAPP